MTQRASRALRERISRRRRSRSGTCRHTLRDTCTRSYAFAVYAHNAQGLGAPVNAAGRPLVSYVADKVADIWSQPYGSGPCTGCHATNLPPPNLVAGAPAGHTGAKNEGALIYQCAATARRAPRASLVGP